MDTLHLITSSGESVIKNCLAKVELFCSHDAFPVYDVAGQRNEGNSDTFQRELLYVMNSAMRARSSRKAWEPLLDKTLPILSAIPSDIDLVESSDVEYKMARKSLQAYYLVITQETWITDMAASKMLFLKRPKLIAISDSYVREAFCIPEPNPKDYPWKSQYCAERALRVSDIARTIGRLNIELLDRLQQQMLPLTLSKIRLLDILVWVDMAIRAGHSRWRQVAASNAWEIDQ